MSNTKAMRAAQVAQAKSAAKGLKPKSLALPPQVISVEAKPGVKQPLFYKGSIILIEAGKATQIDLNALGFQSRAQLERALKDGDLVKVEE